MRGKLVAAGVVALAGAVPLAWLGYLRGGGRPKVDLAAAPRALEAAIRDGQAQAGGRAKALADLRALADVVATDARTVMDMTTAERGFRPRGDEHIEIGQIPVAGGAVSSLIRLPEGTAGVPHLERRGTQVLIDGPGLRVAEVVEVTPSDPLRAAEVHGLLAVSLPVDLAPVRAALDGRGAGIIIDGQPLWIDLAAPPAESTPPVAVGNGVSITQTTPAGGAAAPGWAKAGGPIAGALGLLLLGLGLAGRRKVAAGTSAPPSVPAPPGRPAAALAIASPSPSALATTALDASAVGPATTALDASGASARLSQESRDGGSRFGRYQTISLLGSGGMADVYLARATGEAGFARRIALKVLQPHMARRPEAVNYFLNEARLAAQLTHPCIVQVFDLGRAGDDYYIAMEYVDGADLDRVLRGIRARGARVPAAIALAILRRVCDGLHAAHVAKSDEGAPLNIIHRDVKTANVLLSSEGAVKVGDFGIARAATGARTTSVGQTRGTIEVMAPEQRAGEDIDVRADVYGVAALGYELLSGEPVNLDLAILLQRGLDGWPHLPRLAVERPELPPELDDVILGALAFDPADRPPSCAALEELLAAIVAKHNLFAGDKDLAAWFTAERDLLAATSAAFPVVAAES